MEKTKVMVYFNIKGDDFPLETVTDLLGIIPTKMMKKGELRASNNPEPPPYFFTSWAYGTDYEEPLDIDDQLLAVLEAFKDKVDVINFIQNTYDTQCTIGIAPEIYDGRTPGFTLKKDIIEFAYRINANIDIDLYAMPYVDDPEVEYGFE